MLTLAAALALTLAPTETPVVLQASPAPLHGTLLQPDGPARAAAVILPGSGPTDRNGDTPQAGYLAQPYKLLAEALAGDGVATLRIDKRGIGESRAAAPNEESLRFDDLAADARAWAAEAADRTGQSCAWLIGHSEGALVALAAVRTPDDRICGLVLVSGAGRPAGTLLREQLAPQLPPALMAQTEAALTDLEAGRTTANVPGLEMLFRPSVQPYLISWLALDPAALAGDYGGPILIVQGTTDIQVGVADAEAMAAAQPAARLIVLEGVNHVLKAAPADRAANIATYRDPSLPLAPGVADAISGFILQAR